jgi:hypothetical protein
MTTQAVTAIVGNSRMAKTFSDTSTDGTFEGNILNDDISGNPLGLIMPGVTIDKVCVQYTAGNCYYRIVNTTTNQVMRRGIAALASYTDNDYCKIAPYRIQKQDSLQVFPLPVDATANQTNVLAWVHSTGGTSELYSKTDVVDATATEILNMNGQGVGDSIWGKNITRITVQAEDGATVTSVTLLDSNSAIIYTAYGTKRGLNPGSRSNYFNLDVSGLQLPVTKGTKLMVTTVSA